MKKYLLLLLAAALMIQGCGTNAPKEAMLKNSAIDADLRKTISKLNNDLVKAISIKSVEGVYKLMSDSLKDFSGPTFETNVLPQMQQALQGKQLKVFDEYYVCRKNMDSLIIVEGGQGSSEYGFAVKPNTNETYISMLLAGDATNEIMITIVYARIKKDWKINILKGGYYSIQGKTANDYYTEAQQLYNSGDIIDAINTLGTANSCLSPSKGLFMYKNEGAIRDFTEKVGKEANEKYPLPYILGTVKTKPQIFSIHYQLAQEGMVPVVMYQTTINLKDTTSLKKENEEVQKAVGAVYTGMTRNNKYIMYSAYNEKPEQGKNGDHMGFVQKINN